MNSKFVFLNENNYFYYELDGETLEEAIQSLKNDEDMNGYGATQGYIIEVKNITPVEIIEVSSLDVKIKRGEK